MWFYIILFWTMAVAQNDQICTRYQFHQQSDVASCIENCLAGQTYGSHCASDIKAWCDEVDGVDTFIAEYYMACMYNTCVSDSAIFGFMSFLKDECKGLLNDPLTKLKDVTADRDFQWALQLETSRMAASATRSSTTKGTPATSSATTSEVSSTSSSSTSEPGESSQQSSEPSSPPPAPSSTPPSQAASTSSQAGNPTPGFVPSSVNTANANGATSSNTAVGHIHSTSTVLAAPESTTAAAAAAPALSTTAIAGTAAGGTLGIALIVGLIFFFLRRRKRQSSLAPSTDIWEPSRNTSPKPKLPNIQNDSSFGRYSEMGAGVPVRQRSKAELHSEDMQVPRLQTGYFRPPEMHGGGGENARYYNSAQPSEPHGHGSNMDSRYPELSSHAVTSMSSPTSPISQASTMQGWHANLPSGAPIIRLSSTDLRSEGMRSPVSELGTHAPLRSTRSVELHGAGTMSPMSELGAGSFHGAGHGAAELHNEPLLPPQIDSRSKGDVPDGVVEIDDSDLHRGHRPGVSTNF